MYRVPDTRNSTAISKTCLPKSLVSAVSAPAIEPNEPISPPCLCSKKFRAWPEVRRLVRSLRGEQAVWSRSSPPPTLCSCTEYETLAIAPHSQRHVCQIAWLARSLFRQSRRMSPFRRPVSAAENSVPDSTFGDLVRSLRGGQPVWSRSSPPSSLPELRKPSSIEKGPFLRGSCHLFSTFPVSGENYGRSGGFLASSLCIQKFRSWRLEFRGGTGQPALGNRLPRGELRPVFRTYCGFNPRVSNCRLHSAGASRSRSTPMPRGKRPSTAALTRSG